MIYTDGVNHEDLDSVLVQKIELMELLCGFEFTVTSAVRPDDPKCHGRKKAVDVVAMRSRERWQMLKAAIMVDINRIGIGDTFLHLDVCTFVDGPKFAPNVVWTYYDKERKDGKTS